jgi:hypothetical protein
MQRFIFSLLSLLLLQACDSKPPIMNTTLPLKQVMEWVIDPAADVIWDSVKTIITEKGTEEIYPKTDEQWEAIRNASASLIESGNLLKLRNKKASDQEWITYADRLSKNAELALKAANDRNKEALFDVGGSIYNSCKACHEKYAVLD